MNLYFPQLATGTSGQFPLCKRYERRTVLNQLADGSELRVVDADAARVVWELEYSGLSDAERSTLTEFFDAAGGRLRSFVFLDPCGNLLAHSQDLSKPVWEADTLLRVETQGEYTRLVNTAQTVQSIAQSIEAPGRYRFCGSARLRSDTPESVRLWIASGGQVFSSSIRVSDEWATAICSGEHDTDSESLAFGIELEAGAVIEIDGLQLEAQPGRSGYRRTGAVTARYAETRFDQDLLEFRADGPDNHSTTLRLVSRVRL